MKLTIFRAAKKENEAANVFYPVSMTVSNEKEFLEMIAYDHVCSAFRGNRRSKEGFISADCLVMDNDNDHSDDPKDWIRAKDFAGYFPNVSYVVVPSRNNMKPKGGKSARPRQHIYFPIGEITDMESYTALKKAILKHCPILDSNAADAARFIFGCKTEHILWHERELTVDRLLSFMWKGDKPERVIPQGQRNSTMSRFAGKVLKRYGMTERAHQIFMEESDRCRPPLERKELETIWRSASSFAQRVISEEGYIMPEEYNSAAEGEREGLTIKPDDYSDIGQAKVFVKEYGDEVRYTAATDFIRYNGKCWEESKQRAVGAVEEFLDLQLEDANSAVQKRKQAMIKAGVTEERILSGGKKAVLQFSEEQKKLYKEYESAVSYRAFVMKRRDMKYIISAMQAAKPMLEMKTTDLDADGMLLNTPEGTYDLRKGLEGRRPHKASDYITKMTAYAPSEEGKKEWQETLELIFQGDRELIEYVQQIAGLCAIGNVYLEEMIISYGAGSNGKSTFWNTIAGVLGSYSGNISSDTLTVGCKRNVKPELAEAKGKRLLIASELEEGMRLNTSTVKQLCSTDEIFAEKKYKDPFSFKPSHTLVLYTNHLPKVGAMDDGIWRRMIVIPFNAKISGKRDIKNYSEYLIKNSGGYIMKWIIEGAKKVIGNHFRISNPKVVQEAVRKYRQDNDWLSHFVEECCEIGDEYTTPSGEVYTAYREYCSKSGEFARGTADFYNALEKLGIYRKRTKKCKMLIGIKISE